MLKALQKSSYMTSRFQICPCDEYKMLGIDVLVFHLTPTSNPLSQIPQMVAPIYTRRFFADAQMRRNQKVRQSYGVDCSSFQSKIRAVELIHVGVIALEKHVVKVVVIGATRTAEAQINVHVINTVPTR